MTTQPMPWETGQATGDPELPKGWYRGMPSPNPRGRPPGITDKKAKLTHRMLADADGIIDAMVAQALDGDTGAASLILSRVLPTLRSQTEKVQFPFDPAAPIPMQIEAVLAAIAAGALPADVGQTIIAAIGTLSNARAVEELEARIVTLEAKEVR
jgi:hypothetical protein